jgi:hypothetical protein
MANSRSAVEGFFRQPAVERGELALGAPPRKNSPFKGGDAGGIVSAILKPLERVQKARCSRLCSENADDSTHVRIALVNTPEAPLSGLSVQ